MYALICMLCFDLGELFTEEIEGMSTKFNFYSKTEHVCMHIIPCQDSL